MFYDVTSWCTLTYFVFAWWDLQRSKAMYEDSSASAGPMQASPAT